MINNQLDPTDIGLLSLLQNDARLTHKELGERLHKTVTPIHLRVRKLEEEGYIKRYSAIVDPKKIGRGLIAYTQVQLKQHSQESLQNFQLEVVKLTEIMECYHMTGAFDFLLKVAIKDMDEYNLLVMNKLSKLPDVGMMQSFFVMSEAKNETAYDLASLLPGSKPQ
ncbi:MAG: winged helix-turn-helix transcriptional regulator [Mucilaginibacter sp.]|uniref:Lrp/AsnC family transcriptional regulator n=1 Tax=Mucilaginibacter sp. TaxID=1882438 RepID=UPI00261D36F4|nr:Lrp/AsnC family transcriptional regulator [Mucilaginibacter sp.]MDB5004423.1 winged helix-turn-helix transcriptional regulator [Mucilaginibacter sp.]